MEYKLSEQELKDLMHRTWLKAKKFYSGKEDEYFYDYFESEKKQLPIHVVMQKKFAKYFKLYKEVKRELEYYVSMRGSSFGVGVGADEYAVKWQGKQMRLEILEAFLEGRKPNWYFAYYLNNEERETDVTKAIVHNEVVYEPVLMAYIHC